MPPALAVPIDCCAVIGIELSRTYLGHNCITAYHKEVLRGVKCPGTMACACFQYNKKRGKERHGGQTQFDAKEPPRQTRRPPICREPRYLVALIA